MLLNPVTKGGAGIHSAISEDDEAAETDCDSILAGAIGSCSPAQTSSIEDVSTLVVIGSAVELVGSIADVVRVGTNGIEREPCGDSRVEVGMDIASRTGSIAKFGLVLAEDTAESLIASA